MRTIHPKPNLLMTEVEGEAVLLDLESSYYFSLNETGTHIWRAIEKGKNEDEIIVSILAEWDVEREEATRTVNAFFDALIEEGLVTT